MSIRKLTSKQRSILMCSSSNTKKIFPGRQSAECWLGGVFSWLAGVRHPSQTDHITRSRCHFLLFKIQLIYWNINIFLNFKIRSAQSDHINQSQAATSQSRPLSKQISTVMQLRRRYCRLGALIIKMMTYGTIYLFEGLSRLIQVDRIEQQNTCFWIVNLSHV